MAFYDDALAAWDKAAAGQPNALAVGPIMAAIASAESSNGTNLLNPRDTNGYPSYGAWQINGVNLGTLAPNDPNGLTNDLNENAQAAVSIFNAQGLAAWGTYTSGAYKAFLPEGATFIRPGTLSDVGSAAATAPSTKPINFTSQGLTMAVVVIALLLVLTGLGQFTGSSQAAA